jgi:hypothetical protein
MIMRKYFRYKLITLALFIVSMAACDTANQDVSPVISPNGKPVATFTAVPGTTVTEGDTIFYTITIDKMIDRSITFSFNQTGGTAVVDEDYTVAPVVLEPYTTSVTMMFISYRDDKVDPTETIIGEIGAFSIADRYLLNPSTVNPKPTLTLNNYVSPVLNISFAWEQTILIDNVPEEAADAVDFDFFVSTAADFDISDPWASEIGIYDAATASQPELLTLSGLDDGEYILWADTYTNVFKGSSNDSSLVFVTTNFTRQGTTLDLNVKQDSTQALIANVTPPFDGVCAKVIVAGSSYTIVDYKGIDLGTYKKSAIRVKRPANIPKKK